MEFLSQLWMPILVSSLFVFLASFLSHMVLPIHKGEWKGLPEESRTLETLRGIAPGNYMFPFGTMADMRNPEFMERQKQGANGTVVVWPGPVSMGRNLGLTLLSYAVIGVFVAYVTWHSLQGRTDVDYLTRFRIAGAGAFMAHGLALVPHAIWYRGIRLWSVMVDALLFALLTAGTFGWLWPM